jgi:anti-sigma factor (TIGR02949 family)
MKPMLDCESVMRQLWDYLDEELPPERMEAVRAHLAVCKRCVPQANFERAFLDAVAKAQRGHGRTESLRERVVAALRVEGFVAPASSTG